MHFVAKMKFANANEVSHCLGMKSVTPTHNKHPPHTHTLYTLSVCVPFNLIACSLTPLSPSPSLSQAIAGEIGMDQVLDNIANSLFNGLLPAVWSKLAPATCKQLASWLEHLNVSRSSLISPLPPSPSMPDQSLINLLAPKFRIAPCSTSIGPSRVNLWSCGCLDCIYRRAISLLWCR